MAKLFVLIGLILSVACVSSKGSVDSKIVGNWEGFDHTQTLVRYLFNRDGTADIVIDGKSFQNKISPNGQLFFTFDDQAVPNKLTLFAITERNEQVIIVKKIVKFMDNNTIKAKANNDNTFPQQFLQSSQKTEMQLRRVTASI